MTNWNWSIENESYLEHSIQRCKKHQILLPTFEQLKHPEQIPAHIRTALRNISINELHPLNLYRINWFNDPSTGDIGDLNFLEIPSEITGVRARIFGLIGKHFPTGAHKVGATYGCLTPYIVSGRFDPEYHKAVWPSTGNFCRGGAFNSRLMDVKAVAILPEQMSQERFDWLRDVGAEVYATPGCESNVKEIYDKCHELTAESDQYLIFNQFDQFGNSVWHYEVTGYAIEVLLNQIRKCNQRLSAYVSATGSAGTIAAGDYLRTIAPQLKVVASEALQCPTLLMNGFGAHRIEGIGDKHIPWIHNMRNTDVVTAIDDDHPLRLLRLFNETEGWNWMRRNGVSDAVIHKMPLLGISSCSNIISAVKTARYFEMNENDIIITVFTDSAEMYLSRLTEMNAQYGPYSERKAEIDWNWAIARQGIDYMKELNYHDRKTIHNLKYFTWVEQQGKDVEELNAQWFDETYWPERFSIAPVWDKMIIRFNQQTGLI